MEDMLPEKDFLSRNTDTIVELGTLTAKLTFYKMMKHDLEKVTEQMENLMQEAVVNSIKKEINPIVLAIAVSIVTSKASSGDYNCGNPDCEICDISKTIAKAIEEWDLEELTEYATRDRKESDDKDAAVDMLKDMISGIDFSALDE